MARQTEQPCLWLEAFRVNLPVQTLRERRKSLRLALREKRRQLDQRLAALPTAKRAAARRRRLWAALLLIILLCLSRCSCTTEVAAPPKHAAPVVVVKIETFTKKPKAQTRAPVKIATNLRAKYGAEGPVEPAWVEAFRLQVAARSQRLAQCFVGASKPGVLRWKASLTAETGAVFDHHLEAVAPSEELTAAQQRCVVNVLSNPSYGKLATTYAAVLPESVSLVLEF